jgi:hypothetical protein
MAGFDDCIRSAVSQGFLKDDEAEALLSRYREHVDAQRASGIMDADAGAKAALAKELDEAGAVKKAVADGGIAARDRIAGYLRDYRTLDGKPDAFEAAVNLLENFGGGTASVKGRGEAIARASQADLSELLSNFRRSRLTGERFNKPKMENVVREAFGENTGSAEAKGMANALANVFEARRTDFNKGAGFEAIGKIDNWMPQSHDAYAVLAAKFEGWRDFIKPRLDIDRMRDPATGGKLSPERLDEALKASWNRIVTGGWDKREPSAQPFGMGSVATQRSEHRFFHFKSADDWLAYNENFGSGDPAKAIFNHIRGMSHDIAAMDVLGPNPNSTVTWLKQVLQSEAGKSIIGEPSLLRGVATPDTGARIANRLQAVYDTVQGPEIVSKRVAKAFGDVSNVFVSAYLGSTSVLSAVTDPFIDRSARYFNGLPQWRALYGIVHAIKNGQTREQAIRSGLGLDDFLHIMGSEARYAGTLGGGETTRWLADRTVNLNGLEAITQARKSRFGLDFQAMVADHAGQTWDEFGAKNEYGRRAFERYGFNEKDWNALRKTDLWSPAEGSAGYLQPTDVKNRDLKLRYLEMILGETERAVPTGTARSRAIVAENIKRGTVMGELINSGLQFKSFVMSFTGMQIQAMQQELHQGAAAGAAYAGSMFVGLTLGGAMAAQLNNLIGGKDFQPMDPTTGQGVKFWLSALLKGGGLGLMGDFLFQDLTRFGHSVGEQLSGPTISLASDLTALTAGNIQKLATGKKTSAARDAIKLAGRNVPVVSSLPYTRAAYQRMVIDQLQYLADPEAHKYFREQEMRLRRDTGQGFTWRPGEMSPERFPEFVSPRK